MVATFVTKMLISVTPASRLMTAIELGSAIAAMMIGRTAPTTVPNTASRMSIAIGRLISSAWTRSRSIASLNSCWTSGIPVTTVSTPSRRADEAGEVLGVVDRGLELLVEADEGERLCTVVAQEGRVTDVGVGEDLGHDRLVGQRRHGVRHRRLEVVGVGGPVGIREDDDQARRLLPEAVGEERLGAGSLRAGDLPAALAQPPTRGGGPHVEADDDGQTRRTAATVAPDTSPARAPRRSRCERSGRRPRAAPGAARAVARPGSPRAG